MAGSAGTAEPLSLQFTSDILEHGFWIYSSQLRRYYRVVVTDSKQAKKIPV